MPLIVCSLRRVSALIRERRPSHLITLLGPELMVEAHPQFAERHLRLTVNDIAEPTAGLIAPDASMVETLLAFGALWDERRPMLIHCWAGISRSSAAAYILACARNPDVPEAKIAERLRARSRVAQPNARLVALADQRLKRHGRMRAALDAISPGVEALENEPFDLPARFNPASPSS
jgi:predicted protein tyrosine phosphatase